MLEYSNKFLVTSGMFSENRFIKPYAIADLFQEIALQHVNTIRLGDEFLNKSKCGWILVRQHFEILNSPHDDEEIIVSTFPHEPTKIGYYREYNITNSEGLLLVRGIALWELVNLDTKQVEKPSNIYPTDDYKTPYFEKVPRIKMTNYDENNCCGLYTVVKSDIDRYHHMNNARYLNIVYDFADLEAENYQEITIQYHHQAVLGDIINIYKTRNEKQIFIAGATSDNLIFSCLVLEK